MCMLELLPWQSVTVGTAVVYCGEELHSLVARIAYHNVR